MTIQMKIETDRVKHPERDGDATQNYQRQTQFSDFDRARRTRMEIELDTQIEVSTERVKT